MVEPLYTGEPYLSVGCGEIVNVATDGGAPDSIYCIIELCKVFRITPRIDLCTADILYFLLRFQWLKTIPLRVDETPDDASHFVCQELRRKKIN